MTCVEVGLHGAHPVRDAAGACLLAQELQVAGGGVDRGDVRLGEALEEREGARAGAAAQVHDLTRLDLQRQPGGDGCDVLGEDLGVQLEDLRLSAVAVMLSAAMTTTVAVPVVADVAVGSVLVRLGHGTTVGPPCA